MSVTHSVLDDVPGSLHGACTRAQLVAAHGIHGLRAALATGAVVPMWSRVLVAADRRRDPRTTAAAALLVCGERAVVDGLTAAALHGFGPWSGVETAVESAVESATGTAVTTGAAATAAGTPALCVEVVVPYDRWVRPRPGLRVRSGRVAPADVASLDGLPVLAADAVLAELLCTAPAHVAVACADRACRRDPAMRERIARRVAARADRRGTSRAAALAALVDGRAYSLAVGPIPRHGRVRRSLT